LYGARLSLLVGALVTLLATGAGIVVGLASGASPRADRVLMRIMDGIMAFPDVLLAIGLMASLGPSVRNVILSLGFVYTPRIARVVRAAVLVVVRQEYEEAARAVGAAGARIRARHGPTNPGSPAPARVTGSLRGGGRGRSIRRQRPSEGPGGPREDGRAQRRIGHVTRRYTSETIPRRTVSTHARGFPR